MYSFFKNIFFSTVCKFGGKEEITLDKSLVILLLIWYETFNGISISAIWAASLAVNPYISSNIALVYSLNIL